MKKFPGAGLRFLRGTPTCKALAEDIVEGDANETDCVYLRENLHKLSEEVAVLAGENDRISRGLGRPGDAAHSEGIHTEGISRPEDVRAG